MRKQQDFEIIQKNGKNYVKNWWNIDYYKQAYESLAKKLSNKNGWWYDITKNDLDKEMGDIFKRKQDIANAIEADNQRAKNNNFHYSNENLYNPRRQYIQQQYNNQQYFNDYSNEEKKQYGYWFNKPKKYNNIFQNQGQNIVYNNVENRINQYHQNNNNLQNHQYSYQNYNNIGYYNQQRINEMNHKAEIECFKYNEQIMQDKYNQQKIQKQNIQNLNDRNVAKEKNNIFLNDSATFDVGYRNKINHNHKNQQDNEVSAYPYKSKIEEINSNIKFYNPSYKKTHITQENIDSNFWQYRQDYQNGRELNNNYTCTSNVVDYINNICKYNQI